VFIPNVFAYKKQGSKTRFIGHPERRFPCDSALVSDPRKACRRQIEEVQMDANRLPSVRA
jgi:hypothetical protein